MYKFVNFQLGKDVDKLVKKGWTPSEGRISGNSIEFDADCSSYLYYGNVNGRNSDLSELKKLLKVSK